MTRNEMKEHELDMKRKEINGHVRTWQETQKSMEFVHSGGYEAV